VIRHPLVIVGAGPAGLAAAVAAAEAGLRPLVLDEQPRHGGQIYRQPPAAVQSGAAAPPSPSARRGALLLGRFHALRDRITLRTETRVWGLFPPRRLAVLGRDGPETIEAEQLILAPGAYEYVPPFPGWTLPGVMTPGGAQQMAKAMHVPPGNRAVVAGTGPFLLVVALELHRAGVDVAGVVEAVTAAEAVRALPRLLAHPGLFGEGVGYLYRLRRAGIPVHRGQVVVEARGEGEVQEVVAAPCDREWRPNLSRARRIAVDTLCVGYGFVPRTQLAQLAGCRMRYVNELGGWVPEVDKNLQTSVPGVWVAGDGRGVAGALVAQEEGTLTGLAAAQRLGALRAEAFARARQPVLRRLRKLGRFRAALDALCHIRPGLSTLATPDTVVCRCEELTRAEVEPGLAFGGTDLRTLKVMTRLGMGPCQGRMCWPAAARWIAARTGKPVAAIGPASVRPPITPLCLGDLAQAAAPTNGRAAPLAEHSPEVSP
jgi:NADPH-dependent 2,4-dienoyl-CoA reductase/sulfur reductase-like enzyme